MAIRSASVLTSALLHGSLALFFVAPWAGGSALEAGDGNDEFLADQGITIEGVGFGTSMVTTEAVEETPMEMSAAQPEIKEVIAPDAEEPPPEEPLEALPEETEVITSDTDTAPALEAKPEQKEEVVEKERPQEAQVATLEQQARVAIEEQRQAGAERRGGEARDSAKTAYKRALWKRIFRRSVGGSRGLKGRVVVRITIGQDGKLLNSELVKSSGLKRLDRLALRNVKRAAPFKSLPDIMSDEPFVAMVPFNFTVKKKRRKRR